MKLMIQPTRLRRAISHRYNVFGLVVMLSLSVVCHNPSLLIFGVFLEAAFLLSLSVSDLQIPKRPIAQREPVSQEIVPVQLIPVLDTQDEDLSKDAVWSTLRPEAKANYARLESAAFHIKTQCDRKNPAAEILQQKMSYLMEKFLLFALREVQFRSHLLVLVEETRDCRLFASGASQDLLEGHGAQLRFASSDKPFADLPDLELRMLCRYVQERYEPELRFIARERLMMQDGAALERLDQRALGFQRRTKYVAQIAQILTNLHYEQQMLITKFEATRNEVHARTPGQLLSDINAIVLEADSMTRTLSKVDHFNQILDGAIG